MLTGSNDHVSCQNALSKLEARGGSSPADVAIVGDEHSVEPELRDDLGAGATGIWGPSTGGRPSLIDAHRASTVESPLQAHEMLGRSCDHAHVNNPRRAGDNLRPG